VIAIDGPSGSGKSSASRGVATRLRLRYLDTGAMYRAATWSAMAAGIELSDVDAVAEHVRNLDLRIGTDPRDATFEVGETNVHDAIREPRISANVSAIATNLAVRAELIARQRAVIEQARADHAGIVAEGRDITTVVAPDADVRVLLTASEGARLARRDAQLGSGTVDESDLRDQVLRRDRDDATVSSFHEAADGVVHVDSTHLDLDQVIDVICRLAERVNSGSRA